MQGKPAPRDPLAWDDVRFFLALCRSRTLGEAGKRLHVDGSTMSRRLDALEHALGTTLFERGRDGIVATESALRLKLVAEEMEHVMSRFSGTVDGLERDVSGEVRLACPPDAAELLVVPLLPALFERHPKLRLDLVTGERVVDLARREADLALRTARPNAGDLVVTRLLSVAWRVAVSPQLAERIGALRSFDDVPWLACAPSMFETTPGRWYQRVLTDVEPLIRAESLTTQIACLRAGLGAALVPLPSIAPFGLSELKLSKAMRRTAEPWPSDDLLLVTHRSLFNVPRVRAVWDFLREHVS